MSITPAVVLYDPVNGVAMPVAQSVVIPANTRGLLIAGRSYDGKSYFAEVSSLGRLSVEAHPATAPPGTTPFVLDASSPLSVGPVPAFHETLGPVIADGDDLHIQFVAAGAEGDPSEKGSKVEIYWREGVGPTDHLVERIYVRGSTVSLSIPDSNLARDGTTMVGNGSNTRLIVRRVRLATSEQEIDAVVRGYTES